MFLQQADTNSKSLLCLHRKAHLATYEAVGDMPPPSGAQQSMIPIDKTIQPLRIWFDCRKIQQGGCLA